MCKYLIKMLSSGKKLCCWHFENESDDTGRPYAHFPKCGKDACPLAREDGIIPADLYGNPTQIIFYDPANHKRSGIAILNVVICGCCGAVYGINEVKIKKELPWIDLTKEIGGDEI